MAAGDDSMSWGVNVNDSGQAAATAGNTIAGITFGSAGSGKHTTNNGLSIPPWVLAVAAVGVVLVLLRKAKK